MSEKELSALREKVELLEAALRKAAGDWDDIGDRMDGSGEWIEENTIKDGEKRLASLEGQLEEGTIWFIEKEIGELKDKLGELSERLDAEAQTTRKEATDLSDDCDYRLGEIRDELEAAKKLLEEQAGEIAQLTESLEKETACWDSREKDLKEEFKAMLQGLASDDEVVVAFRAQDRRYEGRIDSLQQQLNSAHAKIAQLQQAVPAPSLADQFLGCMIGLALVAGFIWLAVKLFYWVVGLIR
jgi:chromosome segregation ATPase